MVKFGYGGYKLIKMKRGIPIFLFLFIISLCVLVSAVAPITSEFVGDVGYDIEANIQDYYKINEGACIHFFVFNKTDGSIADNNTVSCRVELTNCNGTVRIEENPTEHKDHFIMCINSTVVTTSGIYGLTFVCNDSLIGGYKTHYFVANILGEKLTSEKSSTHNYSMVFLIILFILSLVGIFKSKELTVKFTLYWVCHILFVVGTFAVWQFNNNYAISYAVTTGIFKVLFWVSISAMLPMMILSIAWMIIVFGKSKEVQDLIDRGSTSEEAWDRIGRKR